MSETHEDDVTEFGEVFSRIDWNVYQNAFFGWSGKVLKTEDSHLRKRIPMSATSTTVCHPTLLKKLQISRPAKFWINGFVIATIATKVTRQSVWQVRRESTAKHVADKVTTRPEVGVRCQGLPRKEPQQHEENCRKHNIGRFVHAIMSHPNKSCIHSLLNCKVILRERHSVRNQTKLFTHREHSEGFDLCQISHKIQYIRCMKNDGRNCGICSHFFCRSRAKAEQGEVRRSDNPFVCSLQGRKQARSAWWIRRSECTRSSPKKLWKRRREK